jgi:hypothetical protein
MLEEALSISARMLRLGQINTRKSRRLIVSCIEIMLIFLSDPYLYRCLSGLSLCNSPNTSFLRRSVSSLLIFLIVSLLDRVIDKFRKAQSRYADEEDLQTIVDCFDKTTKLTVQEGEPSFIKFGTPRDKDPKVNIKGGKLKLER